MSTNSAIGVLNADNTVTAIYCHFDGYLSHNGALLEQYYNTQELANALVALGSISYLDVNIAPEPEMSHTFKEPQPGVTVAYHRDRGEPFTQTKYHSKEYFSFNKHIKYLFMDGAWHIFKGYAKDWVPLKKALEE